MPSTTEFAHLFALILFGALLVVVHLAVVRRVFMDVTPTWKRVALFVPPVTPVLAWQSGHHKVAVLWWATLITYVALRLAV